MADDESQQAEVPLDDEAKRLKLEAIKEEARKTIAEAQQATRKATLPTSENTAPLGTVDVGEGVGLVPQVLAYSALQDVAADIADKLGLTTGNSVLLLDRRDLYALSWSHQVLVAELEHQCTVLTAARGAFGTPAAAGEEPSPAGPGDESGFDTAGIAVGPAVTVAQGLASGVAGMAGMFRNDYSISAKETTIGTGALLIAVAGVLRRRVAHVVVDGFGLAAGSKLLARFNAASILRHELEQAKVEAEQRNSASTADLTSLRARWAQAAAAHDAAVAERGASGAGKSGAAETATDDPGAATAVQSRTGAAADVGIADVLGDVEERIRRLEEELLTSRTAVAVAADAISRFDAFTSAATTIPADSSYPPLVAAGMRERLHTGERPFTHVLFLQVDTAGAETVTVRGLFRRRARFVGGLHASYLALEVERNAIVAAGGVGRLRQINYKLSTGELKSPQRTTLLVADAAAAASQPAGETQASTR